MEDYNHIDQLIRQKFEDFEPQPSESVWEKVKARIERPPASPGPSGLFLPVISGIALLVALILLLTGVLRINPTLSLQAPDQTTLYASGIEQPESSSPGNHAPTTETTNIHILNNPVGSAQSASSQETQQNSALKQAIPVRKPFNGDSKASFEKASLSASIYHERTSMNRHSLLRSNGINSYNANSYSLSGRNFYLHPDEQEYAQHISPAFSLGVYFNPEFTFFAKDSLPNSLNYSLGVLPSVSFGKYFLQSGLNFRITHDEGNYSIKYQHYLGSYEDVYLVTFDSTESGVIPTYHTQTVDVYDTIDRYSISETKASYTYLEVPVLFGYRHDLNRFSFYVKGGPGLSLMILRHIPEADYPEEQARIVNVDKQIPVRVNINWQMLLSAGISYQFSDNFSFAIEPTFRYYMTPEFDRSGLSTRHPYTLGIRAGFIYHFKD